MLSLVSDYEASIWTDPFHSTSPTASPGDGSSFSHRGKNGRPHLTGRTLWTAEEDAELAQLVHEHGVIGAWDDIAKMFSIERTGNALSKRWSKIKEEWEDADSAAAAAIAARRKKDREVDLSAGESKKRQPAVEEDDGLTDEEWLAAIDVGSDVEVRDRQSWYACKIVEAEPKRCKIHFVGCGRRYDRWVTRSSDFLRRLSPQLVSSHGIRRLLLTSRSISDRLHVLPGRVFRGGRVRRLHVRRRGGWREIGRR